VSPVPNFHNHDVEPILVFAKFTVNGLHPVTLSARKPASGPLTVIPYGRFDVAVHPFAAVTVNVG